ncbi:MAG: helix-turn-helix transcriptional regulator [Coriobacteriia bacterium]|nr:helix-turn-helix transcriptional regulator [Coriobacteriia bacterium]
MDADFKHKLGAAIKERRRICGLSKQKLALMIGINRLTLRRIEEGIGNPTLDVLLKICDGLDTSLASLTARAEGREPDYIYSHEELK